MSSSRKIEDFFKVEWSSMIPEKKISFDIYIFFEKSNHILRWRYKGETLERNTLNRYQSRGLSTVWIANNERQAFLSYLHPKADSESRSEVAANTPKSKSSPSMTPPPPKTDEGAMISEVINDEKIKPEQKEEFVQRAAEKVIEELTQAETPEEQETVNSKAKEIVKDILNATSDQAKSILDEIWEMADVEPDLTHALNVSTYSVIYAMAFGQIAPDLLADIALAGLLHDVGLSQVPIEATRLPWNKMQPKQFAHYQAHVRSSQNLIREFSPEVSERAQAILLQQHEKFDGTGYPNRLQGFQFDDIAQLVAMAELTDSIASGQWDGEERTLKQAFDVLDSLDKQRSFPEYCNPEIFTRVINWFRSPEGEEAFRSASEVVQSQFKSVVDQEKR